MRDVMHRLMTFWRCGRAAVASEFALILPLGIMLPVSYTHLTLPTIYSV